MAQELDSLVLDLVGWLEKQPRKYTDVLAAWRPSCPRLAVWEEAVDRAYVARRRIEGHGDWVVATEAGCAFLNAARPNQAPGGQP